MSAAKEVVVDGNTWMCTSVGVETLAVKFVMCIEVALGLIGGAELRRKAKTRHNFVKVSFYTVQGTEWSAATPLLKKDMYDMCSALFDAANMPFDNSAALGAQPGACC